MQFWHEGPSEIELIDDIPNDADRRVISLVVMNDGCIVFRESCDDNFSIAYTKDDALAVLREAIAWIESKPPATPMRVDAGNDQAEKQIKGFTRKELTLDYTEWSRLVGARRRQLEPEVREWLVAWELWDLACSPMDDNERRRIRYGHYLGWWDRENK